MRSFSELFVGRDDCYGTFAISSNNSTGEKLGGKARTASEPVTQELYDKHNAGEQSLGIVPIRTDGTVMWFAIDVDTYNDEGLHKNLLKKVYKHNLPLIMTKSKSGGAHLWCFFTEPATAEYAIKTAQGYLKKLGLPKGTEIFPKQTHVTAETVGNWINLPYFGDTRVCVTWDANLDETEEVEIYIFLDMANELAIHPVDVPFASEPVTKEEGSDAPPCIDTFEADGIEEGGRDDTLFHVGVYLQKKYPDEWEEKLNEWNHDHCNPPLGFSDVMRICSSLLKSNYQYKCKIAPMCNACNKELCLTRKFGVGTGTTGEELGFDIIAIDKLESDVPVYFVTMDDHRKLKMSSDDLLQYQRFKRAVFTGHDRVLPHMKQGSWEEALTGFYESKLHTFAAPAVSGEAGLTLHLLYDWLGQQSQGEDKSGAIDGIPYYEKGTAWFRGADFMIRIRKQYPQAKLESVWSNLRTAGAEEDLVDNHILWKIDCPDLEVKEMGGAF